MQKNISSDPIFALKHTFDTNIKQYRHESHQHLKHVPFHVNISSNIIEWVAKVLSRIKICSNQRSWGMQSV